MIAQSSQATMYYNFARTYGRAGNTGKSLDYLFRAFNTGISPPEKFERDESFETLRNVPEFINLLESLRLVSEASLLDMTGASLEAEESLRNSALLSPGYAYPHYLLARHYALRGLGEESLEHLKKAVSLGFKNFCMIMAEEAFEGLRARPEFQRLLKN
ncbi:MAG: hypothetical protein RDV48_13815 [Candidatus Eremiobacteraeota bacterium]|nr:hypothetical protein [Candidatus Eremiobacteraeota bacterium]